LGIPVKLAEFFQNPTISAVAACAAVGLEVNRVEVPPRFRGATSGPPWFHVPGRFGFELLTPVLADLIGAHRPYFDRLTFPGLDGQSSIPSDARSIATDIVRQIQALSPLGSLSLSGHSWGGVVAFEVACQLVAAGHPVEMVILFDSIVPQSSRKRPLLGTISTLRERLRSLAPEARQGFLWDLVRNKTQGIMGRSARRLGLGRRPQRHASSWVETDFLWQATEEACRNFQPTVYSGEVLLFRAINPRPNEGLVRERSPSNGWEPLVGGRLTIVEVPCDHSGVFKEPVHPEVLRNLKRTLEGQ